MKIASLRLIRCICNLCLSGENSEFAFDTLHAIYLYRVKIEGLPLIRCICNLSLSGENSEFAIDTLNMQLIFIGRKSG